MPAEQVSPIMRTLHAKWLQHGVLGFAIAFSVAWLTASVAMGQQKRSRPAIGTEVSEILNAITDARAELRSGVFRATGRLIDTRHYVEPAPSTLFCAFDRSTDSFRFDTRGARRIGIAGSDKLTSEVIEQIRNRTYKPEKPLRNAVSYFARNREYMVEWHAIGEGRDQPDHATVHIELRDPITEASGVVSAAFDPRSVGWLEPDLLGRERTIEELFERFASASTNVEVNAAEESRLAIVFSSSTTTRRTVVVDVGNGFTIREMRAVMLNESGHETERPRLESFATWNLNNGVWVPVDFKTSFVDAEGEVKGYDYKLDWHAVNPEVVDLQLFKYESFDGIWDGMHVVERRDGKREYVNTIGEKKLDSRLISPRTALTPVPDQQQPQGRSPKFWLFVGNAGVILFCVAIFVWKRTRKRTRRSV